MIDHNIRILIRAAIAKTLAKSHLGLNEQRKPDGSWVTNIDHQLTEAVADILAKHYPSIPLVSEEGDHNLTFPCFILDPVDGTAGLLNGTGECSLSLAYMPTPRIDDQNAQGYIAHLFSDFEVYQGSTSTSPEQVGLVSRSEWNKGLYNNSKLAIKPLGSIALKLGLMAAAQADFVVTKRPKSIWDIAAGSILLNQANCQLWQGERELEELDRIVFQGPLLWVKSADYTVLREGLK